MNLTTIVFIVAVCLFKVPTKTYGYVVDDYCWRDYNGIIPSDALKAGVDRNGDPIYIGQTLYNDKLIPGKIHNDNKGIHIEFFEAFLVNETIKILCTKTPEKFVWFKTKYDEIINLKDKYLFEGGYEEKVTTYIGRALSHGEMTVGKVICWPDRCIRLTTIENGTWYAHEEFEILTYVSKPPRLYDIYSPPSFWSYFFLVVITSLLIAVVVLLVRRC